MLLFRSEEDVDDWVLATGVGRGAIFDLNRLWRLATSWYDDRLDLDWRRRTPTERQALFDQAGLTGEFWSLT